MRRAVKNRLCYGTWFFFLCLTATVTLGQKSSIREVTLKPEHRNAGTIKYQAGYFVLLHEKGVTGNAEAIGRTVTLLNLGGEEVFSRHPGLDVPDAVRVGALDAAVNSKGLLVVGATAQSPSGQLASILMVYDTASAKLQRIIRTSPVAPYKLAIDEQNDIWVLGPPLAGTSTTDGGVLHKYSVDGRLVGSYLSTSLFSSTGGTKRLLWRDQLGAPEILANQRGKIFVFLPTSRALFQLSLEGVLLGQTNISEDGIETRWGQGLAAQPDGTLVTIKRTTNTGNKGGGFAYSVHRLTDSTNGWTAISSSAETSLTSMLRDPSAEDGFMYRRAIVGADDTSLILRDWETGTLFWVPVK